jgi:hypothetical protein
MSIQPGWTWVRDIGLHAIPTTEGCRYCFLPMPFVPWNMISSHGTGRTSPMPDTRTLAVITRWLGVSLERIMDLGVSSVPAHQIVHEAGESTPDIVEAHLRADRNLDAKTAAALGRIFRAAYEQFAQPPGTDQEPSTDAPSTSAHWRPRSAGC